MPQRIQRKRTAGWKMPEGAVYVGRPTRWGNPFAVGSKYFRASHLGTTWHDHTAETAVKFFERHAPEWYLADDTPFVDAVRAELAGKDLACWCPLDQPCHADVLLRIANPSPSPVSQEGDA